MSKHLNGFMSNHPIISNFIIIVIVAIIGLWIAYISLSIFTKHDEFCVVPNVENITYSEALNKLHENGFKVEISDSLFKDDILPGYVLEQTPEADSKVKQGRVVYLIINAVSPKQVSVSNLKGVSLRQGRSILEGLGFKDINIVYKLGKNKDIIQRMLINDKPVINGGKVAINSKIILEVSDGRIDIISDSIMNAQFDYEENSEFIDNSQYINPYENSATQLNEQNESVEVVE